jgi:HD-GYP domain-containing protein (c-di-GMP phosphodiesterase class II)
VLLKDSPVRPTGRRPSRLDQARAWAVILGEEFGVPFAFYSAADDGPDPVWEADGARPSPLGPETRCRLLADGPARVQPREGGYQVALLLYEAGEPALVAVGDLPALSAGPAAPREQARLQKWARSVGDRLRLTDQLSGRRRHDEEHTQQTVVSWEALLALDHLLHRVRIHKDPIKNQRRILEAAFALLDVQALIWVPLQPDAPVLVEGDSPLAPPDCRQLVTLLAPHLDARPGEPFLCNDVAARGWDTRFPQLGNLMAFALTDQVPLGWVLAVNKQRSEVRGQRSEVRSPRSEVGGQKSEVRSQRSEVGGQQGPSSLTSDLCPLTSFRKSDAALLTPFAALLGLHVRASDRYQELKELLVGLTRSLTAALDAKDSYTYGHSERVARIAVELGKELGLSGDELGDIYLTGLLHDVGKIGIRDAILAKRDPLTPEEFEHIKQHVTIGYTILSDLRPIRNLLPGVLYHHERVDGTGYPDGLVGDAIPLLARILAVADAYDAMSTTRPYREAMPCRKVEEILAEGAGKQWDRQVVEAFQRCRLKIHAIRQRGVGDSLRQAIDGALRKDSSSVLWRSGPAGHP